MSLNTCAISGNIGKAAELRVTASGLAVCSFSVAVSERKRQQDGTYQDETSWLDCVMFGKRAEGLHPHLTRGTKVGVVGHLRQSSYEQDGQRRSRVQIVVDEVELMSRRREPQQPGGTPTAQAASIYDGDISF